MYTSSVSRGASCPQVLFRSIRIAHVFTGLTPGAVGCHADSILLGELDLWCTLVNQINMPRSMGNWGVPSTMIHYRAVSCNVVVHRQ